MIFFLMLNSRKAKWRKKNNDMWDEELTEGIDCGED